jgi:hypothetical protein
LEELEQCHLRQLLTKSGASPKEYPNQNQWWGASLVSTVVSNIQLILTNVHIRYEDDKTLPTSKPFGFGIRIQNISVQTTNAQWKPGFVQPADGANIFKKLDVKGLSVYWNSNQELQPELQSADAIKQALCPEIVTNGTFILQPFSMQMRMEKNTSKFPLKSQPPIPRFKFDARPEKLDIELYKRQLLQIRLLSREWARFERARQHRKWRPILPVSESPKKWWHFAFNRIVEGNRRQHAHCSTESIYQRAKLMNSYCRAYRRKLETHMADNASKQKESKNEQTAANVSTIRQEDVTLMRQIERGSQFTYQVNIIQ